MRVAKSHAREQHARGDASSRDGIGKGRFSPVPGSFAARPLVLFHRGSLTVRNSLRADEIKLWLTPSAKQRRNPCSGLPAVYPDLSTRHDWPVKKGFVLFVVIANQVEGEFETHFR